MQVKDKHKDRRGVAVLALVCFVLQAAIAPNFAMGNGHMDFCIVFAGVYALSVGGSTAVAAGFVSGLVADLLGTGPIGLMALLLTVFGFVLGIEERNRFADGFVASLSTFGLGSLAVVVAYALALMLLGTDAGLGELLLQSALPTYAMTFVAFLPFAYLQVRTSGKAHGLKGSGKASGLGNHYDIRNL